MADNLKAAAYAAQLTPEQKREIDILSKKVAKDKELSSLPPDIAQKSFDKMPVDQQEDMIKTFGQEDVVENRTASSEESSRRGEFATHTD